MLEEMNELGEEGNEEEDDEEEPSEKKPEELYDPEVEDEKTERAWYHWSNERGPTANQDYQREIEDRGINLLLETLKGPGTPGDIISYNHGGEYGRLGHGDNVTQLRPKCVKALLGHRVVQVIVLCISGDDSISVDAGGLW